MTSGARYVEVGLSDVRSRVEWRRLYVRTADGWWLTRSEAFAFGGWCDPFALLRRVVAPQPAERAVPLCDG